MAVFTYQGTDAGGARRSGQLEASSRAEALRRLAVDRIQPLALVAEGDRATKPTRAEGTTARSAGRLRLSHAQVILFTDELADLLNSGVQLEPALQLIQNREDKSPVKTVASGLRDKLRDGTRFSEALKLVSPSFDELYVNLVAAGEESGALAPLLRRQATHLVAMAELRGRIVLALIYPAFLVAAGLAAMAVFMIVLIPQMTKLLVKTGKAVPWSTFLLMKLGQFSQAYGVFVLAALGAGAALFVMAIRQPRGLLWWDEAKLRIPVLGPLLKSFFYAQFCQAMANLLENGLPLLTSLKLVSRATASTFFRARLVRVGDLVGEGISLTRAMKTAGHFPASLRDLVKVGEQTGELGTTLKKIGERFDKSIQQQIDRIMSMVPLIVIVALGGMVFLIAYSMLTGIFEAMQGMQTHH